MRRILRLRPAASALALFAAFSLTAAPQTANRMRPAPDESRLISLSGNVPPAVRNGYDLGPVAANTPLDRLLLTLQPTPAQKAQLEALVQAQQDPASPLSHHWLTPAEFGARFGASPSTLTQITAWLESHGFTVNEVAPSGLLIQFSGTAGQVAEAFHTEVHHYRVDGVEHIANQLDPQVPAAFAGVVGGIVSLHDFRRASEISRKRPLLSHPNYSDGNTHYLFPADWATIYDLNSLYSAGTNGSGTSIAIVGRSNINLSDVASFRVVAGLAANAPSVTLVSTDPGLVSGDQDESTLDVEWSGAIAQAATVKFVVGASTATTDGVDLSSQYIVNHALAPVVSSSYGSCEQDMGASELAFYNALWQQAASEGISVLVSSGDSGAAGCDAASATTGTVAAVNGLCSSPYSTCVGGTEFNEGANSAQYWSSSNSVDYGSALGYIPEVVWNESALDGGTGLWASTGGVSIAYPQPNWQKAVAPTSSGMRAVPDIALSAAAHDGYIIQENGSNWIISGTSAAAPSFAGVMALVVESQAGTSQGGIGEGNANPALYGLVNSSRNPFHATPSGNNSVPGVLGFSATGEPYNQATGLGSVDGAALVASWPSPLTPGLTLSVSPADVSMQSLATATVTFTATPVGGLIIQETIIHANSPESYFDTRLDSKRGWTGLRGKPLPRSPITADIGAPSIEIASGLPMGFTASWSAPTFLPSGAVAWTLTLTGSSAVAAGESTVNLTASVTSATTAAVSTANAALPITVTLSAPGVIGAPSRSLGFSADETAPGQPK